VHREKEEKKPCSLLHGEGEVLSLAEGTASLHSDFSGEYPPFFSPPLLPKYMYVYENKNILYICTYCTWPGQIV
jgi:hypothetical protein